MEFKINCSPHLKMSEITKRLFNRNFHADIQFSVQGQIIYAHSLELIKRSIVFEQQLENHMAETKLIPVTDYKYENFLEFIRYVYTDECTINIDNFVDILKLATKYKFIKLENEVIRSGSLVIKWGLKYFEHCILHEYEISSNFINYYSAINFALYMTDKQFLSTHPDAVDELLKFERVGEGVTELQIFTAVADWITSYCRINQITLGEGRQRWDKLIKKIRFPTLSIEELRECSRKYPGLLNDTDRNSIAGQSIFGDSGLWISKGREIFIPYYEWRTFQHDAEHKTIFSVSKETVLLALQIGIEEKGKPIEIEISETDVKTSAIQKLNFVQNAPDNWRRLIIILGESIRMKPNFKYMIRIKYLEVDGNLKVNCRMKLIQPIINDPGKTVNLIEASANMVEMFFKPPTY